MKMSDKINELALALAKTQIAMPAIVKNKTVSTNKYSYKYADLPLILEKIVPVISANGLSISQFPSSDGEGRPFLVTIIMHASGQWLSGAIPLPKDLSPQEMGSALTYYRRYAITAAFGIAADEDDDGQMAQAGHGPAQPPTDSGEFETPFGKDKGIKLKDLPTASLIESKKYWDTRLKKEGKPATGKIADYLMAVHTELDYRFIPPNDDNFGP